MNSKSTETVRELLRYTPASDATAAVIDLEDDVVLGQKQTTNLGVQSAYVLAVIQMLTSRGIGRRGPDGVSWIAGSADEWHGHQFADLSRAAMCRAFRCLVRAGRMRQTRGDDGRTYTALICPLSP